MLFQGRDFRYFPAPELTYNESRVMVLGMAKIEHFCAPTALKFKLECLIFAIPRMVVWLGDGYFRLIRYSQAF